MKIKESDLNLYIYYIVIVIQVITINYENSGLFSYLKYIACIIGILYSFFLISSKPLKKRYMYKETMRILSVPILFFLISLIKILYTKSSSPRIINEIMFMVLPIVYAYGLVNTLRYEQIEKMMQVTLIVSFLGYLINLKLNPISFIKALTSLNFSSSESLLESSQFAGTSIGVALYYLYYRKNKFGLLLSILFVLLTFKRLAIVVVVILLFLPKFKDLTVPVNKQLYIFVCIFVFVIGLIYYQLMIPANKEIVTSIFGDGFDKFTMSRYWRFSLIYGQPQYINYGLGSSYDFLIYKYNFSLEMDMCKLFIEVGYIAVFIFVFQYFYAVKRNMYCTILMGYMFFNMITSHCLASMFTWIIVFTIIGSIQYINPNGVKPVIKIQKGR